VFCLAATSNIITTFDHEVNRIYKKKFARYTPRFLRIFDLKIRDDLPPSGVHMNKRISIGGVGE